MTWFLTELETARNPRLSRIVLPFAGPEEAMIGSGKSGDSVLAYALSGEKEGVITGGGDG